jgi:acyl dehydratase
MSNVTFASVTEGQELPVFQRTTDFMHWNRYAAVNDEFVQLHMDDDAGKKVGQKGAFGMGNLQVAYLHNLLRQWLGDDCWVKKFRCELRGMNFKNDTLTAKGKVLKKFEQGGERLVDLELWTENQNGQKLCPGSATVVLYR